MEIQDTRIEDTQECMNKAKKMAMGTVFALYHETKEDCFLDYEQSKILKNCIEALAYMKQM